MSRNNISPHASSIELTQRNDAQDELKNEES